MFYAREAEKKVLGSGLSLSGIVCGPRNRRKQSQVSQKHLRVSDLSLRLLLEAGVEGPQLTMLSHADFL